MSVSQIVRPLGFVLDLDVRGYEALLIAEAAAGMPKRRAVWTYRALALRLQILERLVVSDEVRRDLAPLIKRCWMIRERRFSVVGAALVARDRDEATSVALRKLTRDPRILERLEL